MTPPRQGRSAWTSRRGGRKRAACRALRVQDGLVTVR